MPKLEIKNISKTYKKGTVKALDNFSVTLTSGHIQSSYNRCYHL